MRYGSRFSPDDVPRPSPLSVGLESSVICNLSGLTFQSTLTSEITSDTKTRCVSDLHHSRKVDNLEYGSVRTVDEQT